MCFAHRAVMNLEPCGQIGNCTEVEDLQVKILTLGKEERKKKSQFSGLDNLQASLLISQVMDIVILQKHL